MAAFGRRSRRPRLATWLTVWGTAVGLQLAASLLGGSASSWDDPTALFWIVVVAASLCAVTSAWVLMVAVQDDLAEVGLLGAFAMAVSVLPLVHGLTVPGVLYGPNPATMASVFWALPVASIAAVPLLAPRSRGTRALLRHWRPFVSAHVALTVALATALLVRPSLLPFAAMGTPIAVVVAVAMTSVCAMLSVRQLRLWWISRLNAAFGVAVGLAFIGASSLVWVGRQPFTRGFWLAHAFDILGVFATTIGAALAYRRQPNLRALVRPLTVQDPLRAFEVGLDPLVHRYVRQLEHKDPITRDHVVRTAETAMLVGVWMRLSAADLRTLTLGALLHDIGKLEIPDAILKKPGRLTDTEFAVMRSHTELGERIVGSSAVLADIAPIVRGHHERVDGRGYPDALRGDAIPIMARIVSVCDAFDAMANSRQYRAGMGRATAAAVLSEHAGSQWDERVVTALVAIVENLPQEEVRPAALDEVGRDEPYCGCSDALPTELVEAR